MHTLTRYALPVLLTALAAPPAAAQVYPDRIPSAVRVRGDRAWLERQRDRDQGRETETERLTRTFRIGANGQVDLQNVSGDIVVTRGGGSEARLEIVKTSRARTMDEARENLRLVQIDVAERGSRVEVRTQYPRDGAARNRRNLNVSVTYTLEAPAGTQVTAHTVSGQVSVRDIQGEISAESVSGDVTVANASHVASAKTVSGSVRISNAALDTALEASTVSGDVTLTKSRASRLTLSTVSGNVSAEDVECPRVDMQAVSGNVRFSGRLAPSGRYGLTSHSGDISLTLGGDTGFEVTATSFSGSVRTDLPLKLEGGSQDRRPRQRSLKGVYGNGSAVLDLTTFSGGIVISK
jgi:DUF4097 and DUF4098 domain-containing protein YvlB